MTIKDIASKCGVSVSTVSRVLNNHPYVKSDVREKVLKVIEEEHFIPHVAAVDLVKPQSDTIGLVVRGSGNVFFAEMIAMFEKEIRKEGYAYVMNQIRADDDEIRAAAELAKSKHLKGVILLGGRYDWSAAEVNMIDIPFVSCTFTNTFGSVSKEKFSSVGINDYKEAFDAVELLIENGHKDIAIVLAARDDHSVSQLRFNGYADALRSHGIEVKEELIVETGSFSMPDAYAGVSALANSDEHFTAVFAISDIIAVTTIKALSDAGKRVPDDVSVIAIDGLEYSEYTVPTLTTLVQPKEKMVSATVDSLVSMINGEITHSHIQIKASLREGGSLKKIN